MKKLANAAQAGIIRKMKRCFAILAMVAVSLVTGCGGDGHTHKDGDDHKHDKDKKKDGAKQTQSEGTEQVFLKVEGMT
tara:strand:- start:340 stop:573 length:234 start_codon:yes stop_codon:yes gene_type:complete